MKVNREQYWAKTAGVFCLLTVLFWLATSVMAKDTDIYSVNTKQNCYVLMDSSGSMNFGVYEHTIDYYEMFKYLFTLNDNPAGDYGDYIYDTINNSSYFYTNSRPPRKIYLWLGKIGATIANVNGQPVAFSGDAADPDYLWYSSYLVDTHTVIDIDGNLADDGTGLRRITVDANGYILLDGTRLPLGLDIKAHDFVTLYNGTVVDNGFNGLLNAPGYYFSGYEYTGEAAGTLTILDPVENGDQYVYFFVTGNWANMQAMYNLHYTTNNPAPQGASQGDAAWVYEHFPIPATSWPQLDHALDYPAGAGNYTNGLTEVNTAQSITAAGAQMIQIHFSAFDVQGNGNAGTFTKDYVKLYDKAGNVVAQYDNDNNPVNVNGGWSIATTGDTATLKLYSNSSVVGAGYTIDKIRISYIAGGAYLMQSRMDVAKDALVYVVDGFRGKMNWGFASFKNGDGAQLGPYLNPTDNDDTQRAAIVTQINNVTAQGGTPLMEALQDVWDDGYYGRRNVLDSLLCRKNYVISMTDGFPSVDDDNARIGGVAAFTDSDGDGWTQDPYQGLGNRPDYYDDVAHWMYTHSWLDNSVVTDPGNSYTNVITHHVAFGAKHPLLQDAAGESGGEYITAYNKEQLVAAFYSLAMMMSESVSFTAPVVSVDAVNKIQSGDDLYMGLFLPQDSNYWVGNVKKFKLGDGSAARPKPFMIYDAANHEAINSGGEFVDNTATFWGDDTDLNDTDNYGKADIQEDGTGEVLLEDVQGFFTAATYWNRPIYTYKGGAMVKFDRTNITAADLGINTGVPAVDNVTRDKIINFTHGYTYDANATTGVPLAVRDWILGAIVHSRPVVVDYFNTADVSLPLLKRLVVVGSNDGMLHVFDDTTGRELLAFIPGDMLPKLKNIAQDGVIKKTLVDSVDGLITLYRQAKNPKYLIFGERRGGGYYWNLDIHDLNPLNWTVAWSYTNAEIEQSWSEVKVASIPVSITTDGVKTYKDVAIFTGGYDPEEDFFPEPFTDQDSNGTPFAANGNIVNSEWSQAEPTQDVYNDNNYNKYNPKKNEQGRGIYVVDIDNPAAVTNVKLADNSIKQILPFSVTSVPYSNEQANPDDLTTGAAQVTTGAAQTLTEMKFSFPAGPGVVTGTDKYTYYNTVTSKSAPALKENVLRSLYAVDVYANLFKVRLAFDLENANPNGVIPYWEASSADWKVSRVFSANPGSLSGSGRTGGGAATGAAADEGRKAFYPPSISWGGSKGLFEARNYYFLDTTPDPDISVTFETKDKMASLFFGTGDRENPKYTMIRNRFYAVYDDSSVTAKEVFPPPVATTNVTVTSAPYYEDDLLNLTCDELGKNSRINSCYLGSPLPDGTTCAAATADVDMKRYLNTLLTDDAVYGTTPALENGAVHENDAKGWYITLPDQGKTTVCSHMTYPTTISNATSSAHDNHDGEQVLSQALLYYGTLYFTTYQASTSDPCNPQGNGFAYSLNYLNGSATYDLNAGTEIDITDKYKKFIGIAGIPSGFALIIRKGDAAALANVGGALVGPAPETATDPLGSNINDPGAGLELFYWRDSNSQQP